MLGLDLFFEIHRVDTFAVLRRTQKVTKRCLLPILRGRLRVEHVFDQFQRQPLLLEGVGLVLAQVLQTVDF